MIARLCGVIFGLFMLSAASAQGPSPELQAYSNKLMAEIGAGLECSKMTIILRGQVDALNAEVRRLKDKYEPQTEAK